MPARLGNLGIIDVDGFCSWDSGTPPVEQTKVRCVNVVTFFSRLSSDILTTLGCLERAECNDQGCMNMDASTGVRFDMTSLGPCMSWKYGSGSVAPQLFHGSLHWHIKMVIIRELADGQLDGYVGCDQRCACNECCPDGSMTDGGDFFWNVYGGGSMPDETLCMDCRTCNCHGCRSNIQSPCFATFHVFAVSVSQTLDNALMFGRVIASLEHTGSAKQPIKEVTGGSE